jgi:hypothetical protein
LIKATLLKKQLRIKLKQMKKNTTKLSLIIMLMFVLAACSKWDDYKKYTEAGETIYSGKIDSVKTYPGNQRIKITGLLPADPKIAKAKISWNDGKDSIVYAITKGPGIDTFSKIVPVPEGIYNFTIQTFDAVGNSSMKVNASGTAYGPKYESGLTNRAVNRAELMTSGKAELAWDNLDAASGALGTWVRYTKVGDAVDSVFVPLTESLTSLDNFKPGTSVVLRTQYLPKPNSIDTFSSTSQTVGVMYDVTAQYILNAGINFANSDGGTGRWQTPADWITTADVRNGGGDVGGLDNGGWLPSKALSLEAWWGMPEIPNGKIYQSFTLPAGKYTLVVTAGDCSDGGTKYITVAAGTTLPDIGNVQTSSIVFKNITKWADNKLNFTLASATQVALGLQAGMKAEGNFMKVFKVRLYLTP